MNRPLFDPEHLRIAAELHAKAWRSRWLNMAGGLLVLLIVALGVMVTIASANHKTLLSFVAPNQSCLPTFQIM
jgi:hypothetical protein